MYLPDAYSMKIIIIFFFQGSRGGGDRVDNSRRGCSFKTVNGCLCQSVTKIIFEPTNEKPKPGPIQIDLYSNRRKLEAGNFEYKKRRNCTMRVAKTKALISCAVILPLFSLMQLLVFPCGSSITLLPDQYHNILPPVVDYTFR